MTYYLIKIIRLDDAGTVLESFDMPIPMEKSLRVFMEMNQVLLEKRKKEKAGDKNA